MTSLSGMKAIMRGNNWRNDRYSEGHPVAAVCGRGDLDPAAPEARGCYDSKVTSWRLALALHAEVVNGPTRGGAGNTLPLPAFHWASAALANGTDPLLHEGQPRKFDFHFERMAPEPAVAAAAGGCGGGGQAGGQQRGGEGYLGLTY